MAKIKNFIYISPKYPSLSLVFEQNELLGLLETDIDLTILSCRSVSTSNESQTHRFSVPLLQYVIYPKKFDIIQGLLIVFVSKPLVLVKLLLKTLQGSLNIFSAHKVIAAFLYTLGWIKVLSDRKSQPEWIHADFGQHSATVAFMLSQFFSVPFSFKVHAFDIYDRSLQNLDLLQKTVRIRVKKFSERRNLIR